MPPKGGLRKRFMKIITKYLMVNEKKIEKLKDFFYPLFGLGSGKVEGEGEWKYENLKKKCEES